jgi:hypothetical protein
VAPIDEKMRESRLRWFDKGERLMHQRVDSSGGNKKKCRGRPKIALTKVVKNDMLIKDII